MASLQKKGDAWYCQFTHLHERHTFTIGKVEEAEAKATAAKVDYILMRIRQRLLEVPVDVDIVAFIEHDGKSPPPAAPAPPIPTRFSELRKRYLETFGNGALESNTLYTAKIHLNHLGDTIGEDFPIERLGHADLQSHISRRHEHVAGTTIKKEIDTFRAAWNWACRMGLTHGTFPSAGLVYPKGDDKLPFMNSDEIERRIKAGGDADELWECLYLSATEMTELLDHVQNCQISSWIYPAFVLAAHAGARRSEIMRASPQDVDLVAGVITIREKKRVKGRRTTRRVPLSTRLADGLASLTKEREAAAFLFGDGPGPDMLHPRTAHQAFERAVKNCKWKVMRGWHVLRHSFISALANRGVDQRIIDDFVGHQTEEQRRRYRHMYPSTQTEAIRAVFG